MKEKDFLITPRLRNMMKVQKKDQVTFDDLKNVTKDIMKEKIESGKDIRNIVKEEINDVQGKVSTDIKKVQERNSKRIKGDKLVVHDILQNTS